MKVAVCISGQLRWAFRDSLKSIKKNILAFNDCDVFMQTYEEPNADEAIKLINPKECLVEKTIKDFLVPGFVEQVKAPETNIENMYWMWRNVKKSIDLVPTNGYDAIIRTRSDLIHSKPLIIKSSINLDHIWIPRGGDWRGGFFDMFAISSVENMMYYASIYNNLSDYMSAGVFGHPENILKYHLLHGDKKARVLRFDYEMYLAREQSEKRFFIIANNLENVFIVKNSVTY